MAMGLLVSNDLNSNDMIQKIVEALSEKRFLQICRNGQIKKMRENNPFLAHLYPEENEVISNLIDYNRLKNQLWQIMKDSSSEGNESSYFNKSEKSFVLMKVIEYYFSEDLEQKRLFSAMKTQLYELFDFLLISGANFPSEALTTIEQDYLKLETDIFTVYQLYHECIEAMTEGQTEKVQHILRGNLQTSTIKLFDVAILETLRQQLKNCDVVLLDGFLAIDERLEEIIKVALDENTTVYLTTKYNKPELNFFTNEIYPALFKAMRQPYETPYPMRLEVVHDTALNCAKLSFLVNEGTEFSSELLPDGSLQFITPFQNRETEFRYIAHRISSLLEENCGSEFSVEEGASTPPPNGNPPPTLRLEVGGLPSAHADNEALLREMLHNEIAIIGDKNNLGRLQNALLEDGAFLLNPEKIPPHFHDVSLEQFSDLYFHRKDFLATQIFRENNVELDIAEKLSFFTLAFSGIQIPAQPKRLDFYPVGKYLFTVYDIFLHGINVDLFQNLLSSNWHYELSANKERWDQYLYDFKCLSVFFSQKFSLEEWIALLQSLMEWKKVIADKDIYRYHPIYVITWKSLEFFYQLFTELILLLKGIGSISGDISEHIAFLKTKVLLVEKLTLDPIDYVLQNLLNHLEQLHTNSIIKTMSATYFAENLRGMLNYYVLDNSESDSDLTLAIVPVDNVIHYQYVFFPMFEADRYPRIHKQRFPYTNEILDILSNQKYGFQKLTLPIDLQKNHVLYNQYLFQNVLDFTDKQLIFTLSDRVGSAEKAVSYYGKEIAAIFNSEIPWIIPEQSGKEVIQPGTPPAASPPLLSTLQQTDPSLPTIFLPRAPSYHLTQLMRFYLCPKLFYHLQNAEHCYTNTFQLKYYFRAILFSATMKNFKFINQKHQRSYNRKTGDALPILEKLLEDVFARHMSLFPIFTEYEMWDIKSAVWTRIKNSIDGLKRHGLEGDIFTIVSIPRTSKYECLDYDLILDFDTVTKDLKNNISRISQEDIFIDFLAIQTIDDTVERRALTHYAEMKQALQENSSNCDRPKIVNRMINKINIQFEAGYIRDAILRADVLVDEITHMDFSNPKSYSSAYCKYCIISDICRAKAGSK